MKVISGIEVWRGIVAILVSEGLVYGDGSSEGMIGGVLVKIPVALLHDTAPIRTKQIMIRMINERDDVMDRITFQQLRLSYRKILLVWNIVNHGSCLH